MAAVKRANLATYTYGYDNMGNITSSSGPSGSKSMTYNAADELATVNGSSAGISFDANGNQTGTATGAALAYNDQNQTTSITPQGGSAISMGYTGPRQTLRITNGTASYVYDKTGLTSWGTASQPTYVTNSPQGQVVSERVHNASCTGNYCEYYYLYDGNGSVVALTDKNGAVVNSYSYDPYGNATSTSETVSNPFRYDGTLLDSGTGLYKMGERYYDPSTGRWTQRDRFAGFTRYPQSLNRYAFVAGNPVDFVDPAGDLNVPLTLLGAGFTAASIACGFGAVATAALGALPASAGFGTCAFLTGETGLGLLVAGALS